MPSDMQKFGNIIVALLNFKNYCLKCIGILHSSMCDIYVYFLW